MIHNRSPRRTRLVLLSLALAAIVGCSSYQPLRPVEQQSGAGVTVEDRGEFLLLIDGAEVSQDGSAENGIIFYPGGLVEPEAYVSLFAPLAAEGIPVAILRVPFDLAVFSVRKAEAVLQGPVNALADRWVLAGHSLGGSMAARFLARHGMDYDINGIILLASYPADDDSLAGLGYRVLSVWASEDGLATSEDRADTRDLLPQSATLAVIEGGNHAGFGEYGPQDDDGEALISRSAQHEQTRALIQGFLR